MLTITGCFQHTMIALNGCDSYSWQEWSLSTMIPSNDKHCKQ